jgi:hypothetical protein
MAFHARVYIFSQHIDHERLRKASQGAYIGCFDDLSLSSDDIPLAMESIEFIFKKVIPSDTDLRGEIISACANHVAENPLTNHETQLSHLIASHEPQAWSIALQDQRQLVAQRVKIEQLEEKWRKSEIDSINYLDIMTQRQKIAEQHTVCRNPNCATPFGGIFRNCNDLDFYCRRCLSRQVPGTLK